MASARAYSLPSADPDRAGELSRLLGIRPLTAQLLLNRGVVDAERARRFLEPRLGHLRAPEEADREMAGFARAAERLAAAVVGGEVVGVFGDYDVDGVTTCALLSRFLTGAGARVVCRVARRDAGYGFSVEMADELAAAGCRLIVTGDCGTSDHDAIARARHHGLDVIVVDHHQVPDRDPGAYALLNPHQPGCRFPFKGLASVGVAFYLAAAVRTRLARLGRELPDPRELLDLVAIGTVADLVPLTDENRVLVAAGLRELSRSRRAGPRALLEVAGLLPGSGRPLTAADIGFKVGPLLNAPGRLGEARLALDLLLADEDDAARRHATSCQEANLLRRKIQEQVFEEACRRADALPLPRVLVVAGDGWHPGVVGIVAAKLVERYHRPSVVIALEGAGGRGSARTLAGFDLYRALAACAEHLVRFGGHAAAAGLTVARERIPAFADALSAFAAAGREPERGPLVVDAEVGLEEVDEQLADELSRLGPFGIGNPEPVLVASDLSVDHTRIVGERHLQITLRQGERAWDGIGFNLAAEDPGAGATVQAAFVPEMDTFRGRSRMRLRLRALLQAGR